MNSQLPGELVGWAGSIVVVVRVASKFFSFLSSRQIPYRAAWDGVGWGGAGEGAKFVQMLSII